MESLSHDATAKEGSGRAQEGQLMPLYMEEAEEEGELGGIVSGNLRTTNSGTTVTSNLKNTTSNKPCSNAIVYHFQVEYNQALSPKAMPSGKKSANDKQMRRQEQLWYTRDTTNPLTSHATWSLMVSFKPG